VVYPELERVVPPFFGTDVLSREAISHSGVSKRIKQIFRCRMPDQRRILL
jgi:hypothetical protein